MSRQGEVLLGIGSGAALAFCVCLDPLVTRYLAIGFLPYMGSTVLAVLLVVATAVCLRLPALTREGGRFAAMFVIIMAQFSGIALGKLDLLEVATVVFFGFWLIVAFVRTDRVIQLSPLSFFIIGLVFFVVLAAVNRPPLMSFVAIGEKFALFLLVVDIVRNRAVVRTSARLIVWAGVFSSLVALAQIVAYVAWGYVLTMGAPEGNRQTFLKPTPFGDLVRATGFFPNPAGLNDWLLVAAGLAMGACAATRATRQRLLYAGAFTVIAAAIVVTWSTAALIALAILVGLFAYVQRPSRTIQYTGVLVLLLVAGYLTGAVQHASRWISSYGVASGDVRLELLQLGMSYLRNSPLIGIGVQNFGRVSGNYFPTGPWIFQYPVHNSFVQMATELGIPGGLVFLGFVAAVSLRLGAVLKRGRDEDKWIFKGFALGWVAVVVHMLSEPMAYEGTLWLILGVMEGAMITVLSARPHIAEDAARLRGAG